MKDGVLRDFLIDAGLVSRGQLDSLVREANGRALEDLLVEQGILSEDQMRRALAGALGIPFVVLGEDDIELDALELIPEPIARNRNIVGYRLRENTIEVAVLSTQDLPAADFLQSRFRVVPRLTSRESLRRALLLYQKRLKSKFGDAIARDLQGIVEPAPGASEELLRYSSERLPVTYVADSLLRHALSQKASHVHLEPTESALRVRYRIAGSMQDAMNLPRHASHALILRFKSLSGMNLKSQTPQEGRFRVAIDGEAFAVRVSTIPNADGEKLVLRIVPEKSDYRAFTLEALGFHGEALEEVHRALLRRKGIILVCGPRGAGKTTTLYTLLDLLHAPHLSIATIEPTIETRLPYASQTATDPTIGLSTSQAVRAALKLDPDVVMVEDVSESDTAVLIESAAQSGTLVVASIESSSAAEGLEKFQALCGSDVSASTFVLGVNVVKKICPSCARTHKLVRAESHALEEHAAFSAVLAALKKEEVVKKTIPWKEVLFSHPEECKNCEGGYKGEVGIQEVLSKKEGVLTLSEDALYKAASGLTSLEEVLRIVGAK